MPPSGPRFGRLEDAAIVAAVLVLVVVTVIFAGRRLTAGEGWRARLTARLASLRKASRVSAPPGRWPRAFFRGL